MLVKCGALACTYNINGMCQAEAIEIVDVEEKENIKFKDEDFAVCRTFESKNRGDINGKNRTTKVKYISKVTKK